MGNASKKEVYGCDGIFFYQNTLFNCTYCEREKKMMFKTNSSLLFNALVMLKYSVRLGFFLKADIKKNKTKKKKKYAKAITRKNYQQ